MPGPVAQTPEPCGPNKFYMWRCVVAMAHADSLIHPKEREWLEKIFDRLGLSEDQRETLERDLTVPQDVSDMLRHINDPSYRSQVVYFARLLAWKDGELHPEEETLLRKLHADVLGGIDLDGVKTQVRENVSNAMILHELEVDSFRPDEGLSGLLDRFLLWLGIDLMDE